MTQNQIDFIAAIRTVSADLADYVEDQIASGVSFDGVHSQIRRAMHVVDGRRIGRGV